MRDAHRVALAPGARGDAAVLAVELRRRAIGARDQQRIPVRVARRQQMRADARSSELPHRVLGLRQRRQREVGKLRAHLRRESVEHAYR